MADVALTELPGLVHAVGEPHFAKQLIIALQDTLKVDHATLFRFDSNLMPHLIAAASRTRTNIAARAGRTYREQHLYRHDPGTQLVQQHSHATQPLLFSLRKQDIRDVQYRQQLYDRYRLLERISIIQCIDTIWCAVNFYRGAVSGYFKPHELKRLTLLAPLLTALCERHIRFSQPDTRATPVLPATDHIELFLSKLADSLSVRERAVCTLSLRGLTVKTIAAQLGIAPATVATLRHRAFQKLKISSLNELFILCIGTLGRTAPT